MRQRLLIVASIGIVLSYGLYVGLSQRHVYAAVTSLPFPMAALGLVLFLGSLRRKGRTNRLTSNGWMVIVAVALCGVSVALVNHRRLILYRILPTQSLVEDLKSRRVGSHADFDVLWDEWETLQTRHLTDQQVAELAEACLSDPDRSEMDDGTLLWSKQIWGNQLLHTGRVPANIADRYYRGRLVFPPQIIAPASVPSGGEVAIDARAEYPQVPWIDVDTVWAFVDGFYVDDAPAPVGRIDKVIPARRLSQCRWVVADETHMDCVKARVTTQEPGLMRVRLVFWIAVHPQRLAWEPVAWREDGPPDFPKGVLWSEKFEAETVIHVTGEAS